MNIYECIVASVCAIVIGLWGLVWLAGKCNFLEDEKANAKKAYEDNLKKVSGQDLMKAKTKAEKTVKKSLKGKDTSAVEVKVRTKNNDLKMPELPREAKKKGRQTTRKGGHLD